MTHESRPEAAPAIATFDVSTVTAQALPPIDWDQLGPKIERIPEKVLREPNPAFRALPYLSAREVAHATTERPEWIVPGFTARQAITELGGKIKSAGKTTFATHLVAAVLDGASFLGLPTEQTNVIYLTEQTRGSFREALRRAWLLERGDELRIIFRRDVTKLSWRELVAQAATDAKGDGYGLLVVDTLGKFAGIRDENDAAGAAEAMLPLQDAAHDGLGVIVCRHERKGGGEVGEAARGSSAFSGDADIILSLRRPEGNQRHTLREIHSLSRYDETPDRVVIDLTDEGYSLLGDVDSVAIAEAVRIVSIHLGERFESNQLAATVAELAEETELPKSSITRALRELLSQERVTVSGKGVRNDPRRYQGLRIDSNQTPSSKESNESNGPAAA